MSVIVGVLAGLFMYGVAEKRLHVSALVGFAAAAVTLTVTFIIPNVTTYKGYSGSMTPHTL
jgi:predicted Kef-type K+ transport protein